MAVPDRDNAHDSGAPFLEHCYLTYFVPFATDLTLEAAFQREGGGSYNDRLASIEQRDLLFFDETVDVYLVLKTACADKQALAPYLRRLVITVEAQVVNTHAEREGPPASEPIYNGAVEHTEDALVIVDGPADEEGTGEEEEREPYTYAIWKLSVFLPRPRIRLQGPSIVFSASASLKPSDSDRSGGLPNGYMRSSTPSGMNLLEAFADDSMLGGIKPQLSALRVSRVAPVTKSKDAHRRIKGMRNLRLKVCLVVHTRVRFARPNTTPPSPALIALLEVDFTPFFECEVALDKITLAVTDSTVEDMNTEDGMRLPLRCVAHDHLTMIYRLAPQQLDIVGKNSARDLDIKIEMAVLVRPEGPNSCVPHLSMTWSQNVDFTLPVNPGFGQPITQPIQRSHRPSQLSIGAGGEAQSLVSPSVSRPDALPSLEAATANPLETVIPDFGITMTFSGPGQPVYAGEEFSWSVFVVNRSKQEGAGRSSITGAGAGAVPASSARKLALLAIPKRRRNELRVARPPSSSGSGLGSKRDHLIADAVLDENIVHAMQRSSVVDSTEVVCLSADVRVGPLAPNACAVVELRFLALRAGVVGIEAVRVVDLGTQEHVDIRELPTVVVHARSDHTAVTES
ncbi:TRAPP trafficking subunit Trs65-domain-containing protein [Lasiosphaeria hispida]|uniref:TRAPP trafficking subunit Trs65-domain-containing protein n=1 Tax=Lasiosphaeria hispida TaxID=260671 RepID=A0AAJ0HU75_9PEZI|nr:TRAPP trafficking subunit Trs65-domain-containing protein [Lasiosphaeria hispida]